MLFRSGEELAAQQEAVEAMAAYPLAEVDESQWRRMWQEIGQRLPAGAKRISLESLTEMDISANMMNEEDLFDQPVPVVLPASPLVAVKTDTLPPMPGRTAIEKLRSGESGSRPVRLNDVRQHTPYKVPRVSRRPHRIWAHLAGVAAAVAIMAMVVLSVRPVILEINLARAGEVVIEMDVTDASRSMIRMMQDEHGQAIQIGRASCRERV